VVIVEGPAAAIVLTAGLEAYPIALHNLRDGIARLELLKVRHRCCPA